MFLPFQVGLVVLTFLICWLPFFVLALVIPLVGTVPGALEICLQCLVKDSDSLMSFDVIEPSPLNPCHFVFSPLELLVTLVFTVFN